MQKNKEYYDAFFTKNGAGVHSNPDLFLKITELCQGRVLDIGCGTGILSDYFQGDYIGVDISDVAIIQAKEVRRKSAVFVQADVQKSKLNSTAKFDSIVMAEFLEHIQDHNSLFTYLMQVLAENGKLICSVPNGCRVPDDSHCRTFTIPEIRRDFSKYGKITFYNWAGARQRIIFTIEPNKKTKNDVSLVMICKDEEKGIENAILSAIEFVDYVIISVDSKTTDKTAEIAKLYADELKTHHWDNDFSEARNVAQRTVKTDWILIIDGHEYIEKFGNVRDFLDHDLDGINITIKMENGASFMYPRIFKNGMQFENAVHNALDCKKIEYCPTFVIVHDRAGAQTEKSIKARELQRAEMLPKIMNESLKKNKNDQRALFNLGNWHMTIFDFKKALHFYKRCYKLTPSNDEKYFVKAQIGIAHLLSDHTFRALWAFFELEKLIPNRWETKRLIGGAYMQQDRFEKALPFLVEALEPNKKQYIYQLFKQDYCELWDLIGFSFFSLQKYPECVVAWEKAIEATSEQARKDFFKTRLSYVKMLQNGV